MQDIVFEFPPMGYQGTGVPLEEEFRVETVHSVAGCRLLAARVRRVSDGDGDGERERMV